MIGIEALVKRTKKFQFLRPLILDNVFFLALLLLISSLILLFLLEKRLIPRAEPCADDHEPQRHKVRDRRHFSEYDEGKKRTDKGAMA